MDNTPTIPELEARKACILADIERLACFRRGTISTNFRKCGKPNCACAQPDHLGHGPQYIWTATIKGKSQARNLPLGVELQTYLEQTDEYRRFQQLIEQLVEVNELLCNLQPIRVIEDHDELETLKKKLRTRLLPKSRGK